jgi:hypothetical protein
MTGRGDLDKELQPELAYSLAQGAAISIKTVGQHRSLLHAIAAELLQ